MSMTAKHAPETIHCPTEVLQEQGTWPQSHRALGQETSHRAVPIQEKQTPFLQAEREIKRADQPPFPEPLKMRPRRKIKNFLREKLKVTKNKRRELGPKAKTPHPLLKDLTSLGTWIAG